MGWRNVSWALLSIVLLACNARCGADRALLEPHPEAPVPDALIPRLKEMGVSFLVVYIGNPQQDFFYERLEAEGLWIAQDLGNVKKKTLSPFPNTGGVIGTVPDEDTVRDNLERIDGLVGRLSRFRNILFWWMGGEFAEPAFHDAEGMRLTRDSVRRYAEAIRARDPLKRPFTVSHHYVEALQDPVLDFVDLSELTDFTWFTVATHFHLGDFVPNGGWLPVAQSSEAPFALGPLLERASGLNHRRPIFLGGWFAQAPLFGPCSGEAQPALMKEKWKVVSKVPHLGSSTYHLAAWNDNGIPHALLEWTEEGWVQTPAGKALGEIVRSSQ
ncbi:MAG: hypothetical protein ACYC8T_04170 [Myxococcaceae bacterium]